MRAAYQGGSLELSADLLDRLADLTFGDEALLGVVDAAFVASTPEEPTVAPTSEIPDVLRRRLSAASVGAPAQNVVPSSLDEAYLLADAECDGDPIKRMSLLEANIRRMEA